METYSDTVKRTVTTEWIWEANGQSSAQYRVLYEYPDAPDETVRVRVTHDRLTNWTLRIVGESGNVTLTTPISDAVVGRLFPKLASLGYGRYSFTTEWIESFVTGS